MKNPALRPTSLFILIIFLGSCGAGSTFLSQNAGVNLPVDSVAPGSRIAEGQDIPLVIDAEALNSEVDLVTVELTDGLGSIIAEARYEGEQLSFPELPPLVFQNLDEDIYQLNIELFSRGESLGEKESWFYYTNEALSLSQITVNPHSVLPGETIAVSLELDPSSSPAPFAQFRLNGMVVYEDTVTEGALNFELEAPDNGGVYDLRLDLYPWFDYRIDEDSYSQDFYSLEVLVTETGDFENSELRRVSPEAGFRLEEDLWYYLDERVSSRLEFTAELQGVSGSEKLFELRGPELHLSAGASRDSLIIELARGESAAVLESNFNGQIPSGPFYLDVLQGESHVTILIMDGQRVLSGELISYADFSAQSLLSADRVSNLPALDSDGEANTNSGDAPEVPPGADSNESLEIYSGLITEFAVRPLTDRQPLESLFKLILQKKYGNFILYAEGFEFASSINSAISYSDDASVANGYLQLPPGAWVELPNFALDEYLVEIQTSFNTADDLSASSMILVQQLGEEVSEVFRLEGNGELISGDEILASDLALPANINLELTRAQGSIFLSILGNEYLLPSPEDGRFRFVISQGEAADIRIRLDSAAAANVPGEFVERVLGVLDENPESDDGDDEDADGGAADPQGLPAETGTP